MAHLYWALIITWLERCIYAATALRIPEMLRDGPKTIEQLAEAAGAHQATLERVLRVLVSFGYFREDKHHRYILTPRSRLLLEDHPRSMCSWVLCFGVRSAEARQAMLDIVKTGKSGIACLHNQTTWEYFAERPELNGHFVKGMENFTRWQSECVTKSFDFSKYSSIVDVGGGTGRLLAEILRRNSDCRGTLLDQTENMDQANETMRHNGVADRAICLGGSFFENIPGGADLYILKHCLHDWPDDRAVQILRVIAAAMGPSSKLLVVEGVIERHPDHDCILKLVDIERLTNMGGAIRTLDEFQSLYGRAGLRFVKMVRNESDDLTLMLVEKSLK